jgi:murein L,D-transpeptidase YafK
MTFANKTRRGFIIGAAATLATPALARRITTHDISRVQVRKSERKVDLIGGGRLLRSYDMRLGFNPVGHKRFQGDGRTPEGAYHIDRRNAQSKFYLSLGVSYPNARDVAYARSHGRSAGGAIFIHGQTNGRYHTVQRDWTRGCIAVSNADMNELWALVGVGCPIHLYA